MSKGKYGSKDEGNLINLVNLNKQFGDKDGSNVCESSPRSTGFFRAEQDEQNSSEKKAFSNPCGKGKRI